MEQSYIQIDTSLNDSLSPFWFMKSNVGLAFLAILLKRTLSINTAGYKGNIRVLGGFKAFDPSTNIRRVLYVYLFIEPSLI